MPTQSFDDHDSFPSRAGRHWEPTWNRRSATLNNPGAAIEGGEYGIRDVAGRIVIKDVDARRTGFRHRVRQITLSLIVECDVISQSVHTSPHLLRTASQADGNHSRFTSQRCHNTAHGTCGRRYQYCLARLRASKMLKSNPCGQSIES